MSASRLGIVGCGVIGATHAQAIDLLDDADLVAVCDEVPDRAVKLAHNHGAKPYPDLHEMLERESLDLLTICTPSGLHLEPAVAAMRHGVNVLVEKPIEITLTRIDAMLRVQEETGVQLGVVFQHRFDPAAQQVHHLVRDGAFGRLTLACANVLWWRSQGYYDSGAWRGTWALDGGGVLMNQAIHTIDLLLWTMGPVATARAFAGTLSHRMETEDTVVASLRFRSGALGSVVATTGAYPGVGTRLELLGDRGSAVIENDALGYLHLARDETATAGDYGMTPGPRSGGGEDAPGAGTPQVGAAGHAAAIADMVAALRDGRSPVVDGRDARLPVELILAVYESARTGREAVIP